MKSMLADWSCRARRLVCVSVCLVVAALVFVPALVRASQHWDPHQPIRTSIKLNWNGDAPRTKNVASLRVLTRDLLAPRPMTLAPKSVAWLAHTVAPLAPTSLLAGPPNELRGPPASRFS
jgi:hypothetical protein